MEFNKNEATILAGSSTMEAAAPDAGEIDLYDELEVFAGLSPEEQQRLLALPTAAVEEAIEPQLSAGSFQSTTSPVEMETPEFYPPSSSEPADSIAERELSEVSPEASQAAYLSDQTEPPGLSTSESPADSSDSLENDQTPVAGPALFDRSRTGPLLAGLNVPESLFAGDLSLGTCLACGADSGADDLFCVTCGVFIDDIGSTPPQSDPACGECGQKVTADEIFCPWCGATPA